MAKTSQTPRETTDLIGCWANGDLGHQHTRIGCASTVQYYMSENFSSRGLTVPGEMGPDVLDSLMGEMPDDAWDEREAEAWLNEYAPVTGASWGWQDGDFGLWPDE